MHASPTPSEDRAAPAGWHSGDAVVYRHRSRDGRYLFGKPVRILDATPERVVAFLAGGTEIACAVLPDGSEVRSLPLAERWSRPRVPGRRLWRDDGVVLVFTPGRAHSIWFFRGPGSPGWYINLEDPPTFEERTISTRDHVLDIWVPLDTGIPQWKDEDELEAAVAAGRITPAEAAASRAEGERVIRERPWPTGWEDFEPDPSWPTPTLFPGWDVP
jgi:hypothetical protein